MSGAQCRADYCRQCHSEYEHGPQSSAEQTFEKLSICSVVRANRLFCADESVDACDRDLDSIELEHLDIARWRRALASGNSEIKAVLRKKRAKR